MKTVLKKVDRIDNEFDASTTARVVESLVLRGDISALNPEERARFYTQMCETLGMNPATQPFAILKLNGKEILYPTRGATDQLAAIHRLNREIVDGPKVIDLSGTKLVYAMCRATLPNGRFETAVATAAMTDPVNIFMKVETKAKRRATLSILGLGMLDETELETIPAHLRQPGPAIDLNPGASGLEAGEGSRPAIDDQIAMAALPAPDEVPPAPPVESNPTLVSFQDDVALLELPSESVTVWLKHRSALATLTPSERETAWKALCKRTEDVGRMKNAKVWLKRAIAEEDARKVTDEARKVSPDNDQFHG